jgi:hypothetical protein
MTENEWQNASEPHAMLECLRMSEKTSQRKLRLFAVACSRRIWGWIDTLGHAAVEAAENFADGLAGPDELRVARLACQAAGGQAAWYAAATSPEIAARNAARSGQAGVVNNAVIGSESAELLAQAALVRDIFGLLPFRPLSFDLTWRTPKVVQLAQEIYNDRTFDRLPRLADTLEEAGCDSQEVLAHCRGPGPHVRGCWVVDAVLGKD